MLLHIAPTSVMLQWLSHNREKCSLPLIHTTPRLLTIDFHLVLQTGRRVMGFADETVLGLVLSSPAMHLKGGCLVSVFGKASWIKRASSFALLLELFSALLHPVVERDENCILNRQGLWLDIITYFPQLLLNVPMSKDMSLVFKAKDTTDHSSCFEIWSFRQLVTFLW